ncbi:hypothetical protein BAE44_0021392 [Dichanthelium oligosanthes]|uniref:Wall-associated receptor kinase galacturonan-binding domain-containing protein n=1 Tax=Dichanthelium oligosanthes TaxID=888268 RepID=A0A1E5UXH4_9POAL|nr:hypothetical protein BAE44_0021392 [Dichanthelium oligosanthes]
MNISYPFGIGRGCFRPGFEVTCNHSTRSLKLFLTNTTTEIVHQYPSDVRPLKIFLTNITYEIVEQYPLGVVEASIVFNIATRPGAFGNYSRSWEAARKSLFSGGIQLW